MRVAALSRVPGRWPQAANEHPRVAAAPSFGHEETDMPELSEKKRDSLSKSQFGLPEQRKYPMPDKSHARNAKARASQQEEKGNLSESQKERIDRKADKILDK